MVSVISRINEVGSSPESSSAPCISSTRVPVSNWRGETLTDTAVGSPASCHRRVWRHASRSTKAPTSTMRPDSSSAGMKSSGLTTTARRPAPPQQRLHTLDSAVAQVDDRLIDEKEFPGLEARDAGPARARCGCGTRRACGARSARPGSGPPPWPRTAPRQRPSAGPRPTRTPPTRCRCWPRWSAAAGAALCTAKGASSDSRSRSAASLGVSAHPPSTRTDELVPAQAADGIRLAQRALEAHRGLAQHVVTDAGARESR